jgi:hypothetical protein
MSFKKEFFYQIEWLPNTRRFIPFNAIRIAAKEPHIRQSQGTIDRRF